MADFRALWLVELFVVFLRHRVPAVGRVLKIMAQNRFLRNVAELNLGVLFISTSGVLGRYIDLPAPVTIGLRAAIACCFLLLFVRWKGWSFSIQRKDRVLVLVGGVLLGLHWVFYFYSLQLSNVAIGMLSLFTYPAITALLEPVLLKTRLLKFHLLLCALVLVGIYFLVPEFNLENDHFKAVGCGVLSALCYALRNIIMKPKIGQYNGSVLMVYQLIAVSVVFSPAYFLLDTGNLVEYLPATLMLGMLTTAIGHTLFLSSLKHFSAITASIISCTQPVFGIIIGMLVLHEYPSANTMIGGAIIIAAVLAESLRLYTLQQKALKHG